MALGTGLLALAMITAGGPDGSPAEATCFEVRVLTMDGLAWRSTAHADLKAVARKGNSAVWTAGRSLVPTLTDTARSSTNFPKVTATGEAILSRKPGRADERFVVKLSGRKLDQGILARVAVDDSHVKAVHSVEVSEAVAPGSIGAQDEAETGAYAAAYFRPTLDVRKGQPSPVKKTVQVPEVATAQVDGEWLIPTDGVLIVGLGVETVADASGKATVRERIAVISAEPIEIPGATKVTARVEDEPTGPIDLPPLPIGLASTDLDRIKPGSIADPMVAQAGAVRPSMPALPGRSLPLAVDPSGRVVEPSPIPEALASGDLDRVKPDPGRPSPQAPTVASSPFAPDADPALAKASFDAVEPGPKPDRPAISPNLLRFADRMMESGAGWMKDYDLEIRIEADGKTCRITVNDGPKSATMPAVTFDPPIAPGSCPASGFLLGMTDKGLLAVDDSATKDAHRQLIRSALRSLDQFGIHPTATAKAGVAPQSPEELILPHVPKILQMFEEAGVTVEFKPGKCDDACDDGTCGDLYDVCTLVEDYSTALGGLSPYSTAVGIASRVGQLLLDGGFAIDFDPIAVVPPFGLDPAPCRAFTLPVDPRSPGCPTIVTGELAKQLERMMIEQALEVLRQGGITLTVANKPEGQTDAEALGPVFEKLEALMAGSGLGWFEFDFNLEGATVCDTSVVGALFEVSAELVGPDQPVLEALLRLAGQCDFGPDGPAVVAPKPSPVDPAVAPASFEKPAASKAATPAPGRVTAGGRPIQIEADRALVFVDADGKPLPPAGVDAEVQKAGQLMVVQGMLNALRKGGINPIVVDKKPGQADAEAILPHLDAIRKTFEDAGIAFDVDFDKFDGVEPRGFGLDMMRQVAGDLFELALEAGGPRTILLVEATEIATQVVLDSLCSTHARPAQEQCDFGSAMPEAPAPSPKAGSVEVGVSVNDPKGMCVLDMKADLGAALKAPGKTETIRVPLGGPLSLEIKATVVATPQGDGSEKADRP